MSYLNIKIKEDFRTLKKGSEYKFDFTDKNYILMVGPNGCGKSSLINTIRDWKCDNASEYRFGYDAKLGYVHIQGLKDKVEIETDFEKFFFVSSEFDDPQSLNNGASAGSFVLYGGFSTKSLSNGQRLQNVLGNWIVNNRDNWNDKTLLIFDEIEKGFDMRMQTGIIDMFNNFAKTFGVKCLAITHYLLPMLLSDKVFWFTLGVETNVSDYLYLTTGYKFEKPIKDETT